MFTENYCCKQKCKKSHSFALRHPSVAYIGFGMGPMYRNRSLSPKITRMITLIRRAHVIVSTVQRHALIIL